MFVCSVVNGEWRFVNVDALIIDKRPVRLFCGRVWAAHLQFKKRGGMCASAERGGGGSCG